MKSIADGYVLSVQRKNFWARLIANGTEFDAQIVINSLSKRDRNLLQENAYICILKGGSIRIRRLKPWTKKEIERSRKYATRLLEKLNLND